MRGRERGLWTGNVLGLGHCSKGAQLIFLNLIKHVYTGMQNDHKIHSYIISLQILMNVWWIVYVEVVISSRILLHMLVL